MDDALASLEKSCAIWEDLARAHPREPRFRAGMASARGNLGNLKYAMGRLAEAVTSLEEARSLWEQMDRTTPLDALGRSHLAGTHSNLGNVLRDMGRPADAQASLERARVIQERLAAEDPAEAAYRWGLATTYTSLGRLLIGAGRPAKAMLALEKALDLQEPLARDNPAVLDYQHSLALIHMGIGHVKAGTGRRDEAIASHEQARVILERLTREDPADVRARAALAESYGHSGLLQMAMGRLDGSMAMFEKARATMEPLVRDHPESPDFASSMGGYWHNMGLIDKGERRLDEAREKLLRAAEWQRKALKIVPNHARYRESLTGHLQSLCNVLLALGLPDEVEKVLNQLVELNGPQPRTTNAFAMLAAQEGQGHKGDRSPTQLAIDAYTKDLYAESARLFARALADDPKLAADRVSQHRYNAACATALASSGRGKDDPQPDDAARAGFAPSSPRLAQRRGRRLVPGPRLRAGSGEVHHRPGLRALEAGHGPRGHPRRGGAGQAPRSRTRGVPATLGRCRADPVEGGTQQVGNFPLRLSASDRPLCPPSSCRPAAWTPRATRSSRRNKIPRTRSRRSTRR